MRLGVLWPSGSSAMTQRVAGYKLFHMYLNIQDAFEIILRCLIFLCEVIDDCVIAFINTNMISCQLCTLINTAWPFRL